MTFKSTWAVRRELALEKLCSAAVISVSCVFASRKRSNLGGEYLHGPSHFAHLNGGCHTESPRLIEAFASLSLSSTFGEQCAACSRPVVRSGRSRHFLCGNHPRTVDVGSIAYSTISGGTHKRNKNESKNVIERDWRDCAELIRVVD